ncbi:AAA family ATPase, partial [Streptomyces zhihengii]|uniref:AAA family ATPase n=1 Tax=Streptomyces zhihengii TaxID=1818004 RepID=UPI00339FA409
MLWGRGKECRDLEGMLRAVRGGASRSLVVWGEPGVGKTALLDYVAEQAVDFRIFRVTGVQSEMELAFSGLHQLCMPLSEGMGRLPGAQDGALRAVLGWGDAGVPDRFLVGLATLGLLAEAGRERPVLCVVDDAQWLDRASLQALAFTARRLVAESVAVVFGARVREELAVPADTGAGLPDLEGLPELALGGLPAGDARALLGSALPGRWDERVLDQIVAETRGNPLALLELPRESGLVEWAGGFGLPGARGVTRRIQELYQRRFVRLPPQTRRLLLVAAAEPGGEPALLWRAADGLGIGLEAASAAVAAELVSIDDRVRFRHPLVRSAVYWAASPEERRGAHRALAEATDARADPDRRAWHAAQGTQGTDEAVAVEL